LSSILRLRLIDLINSNEVKVGSGNCKLGVGVTESDDELFWHSSKWVERGEGTGGTDREVGNPGRDVRGINCAGLGIVHYWVQFEL
jgi:hypothetical protein